MKTPSPVVGSIAVTFKPWRAPSFATEEKASEERLSVPVAQLDVATLNALAMQWLEDLYQHAGWGMPFGYIEGLVQERRR